MALSKMILNINGVDRMLICDKEKDTLADVVRRLGLTGTKVGCKVGQCGICSVILNGEVTRGCIKKMKNISEGSMIVTIEGIGTPTSLHPLQQAFITYGAVQCGFCSPGFIVSAKVLLDQNNNPTRQEVRAWFQKNHNACRCTGYKPIVDSVLAAAKVIRGEWTMEDIQYKVPTDGKIYGTGYPRPAALAKVTGLCDYGDDIGMKMPGALHIAVVLPGVDHGNLISIDTSEAEKMPGVEKIITYKDVQGTNRTMFPCSSPHSRCDGFDHYILVENKILRCGDVVALVAARTREEARAAAKKVELKIEELPAYKNILDSCAEGAMQLHPEHPNIYGTFPLRKGEDTRKIMENSDFVVEGSFHSQHEPHLVLEPDTVQAYVDEQGVVTIHCKTLALYMSIMMIARGIGVPNDKIRIIENPTGASFGYSGGVLTYALMAVATLATGKPCTMTLSYDEHQHITGKRQGCFSNGKLACDKNGKLTALEYETVFDTGAYAEFGFPVAEGGTRYTGMTYYIPNIRALSSVAISNVAMTAPYRAATSPPCFTVFEHLMDMLAEKAGIDPFEFRAINSYHEGDTTNSGHTLSVYPYPQIYEKMRPVYEAAIDYAKKNSTPLMKIGVGISNSCYNTTGGPDHAEVALELNPDGTVTNFNTAEDQGQGTDAHALVFTYEALRPLGLKPEQIKLCMNDTGLCPNTGPAAGSRTHYVTGRATLDAADKLMKAMKKEDGTFRTYDEMVADGIPTKYLGVSDTTSITKPLDPNTCQGNPSAEYMWGTFLSMVEVDTTTGKTKLLKMHAVVDCGPIGNILSFEGQGYSGMMHSAGYALREQYSDPQKHTGLANSGFSFIGDVPDELSIDTVVSMRPTGPFGSSGCSEVFQAGPHMSVINAIYNACGVRIYELPATPDKVKAGLDLIAQGKTPQPRKYYLGYDMWEKLDDMEQNPVNLTKKPTVFDHH
ncbi:molybdopterin-dependent oxidoreductase [Dehalobacter sp. DCM]|uniref:molybdopterin-dependent aldehyde oxidoreductase n=1 Tax=Dehalobacter sp. DCM TaxID=2907827 RepID=UPI003081DBCB|nr:molybdopterin-dependent oxidoreductase [Dehalobacter sp. DCM]